MIGAIRADSVNFPLILHVAGAMLLVASLILAAVVLVGASRRDAPGNPAVLTRYGFRTLLYAVLPSFLLTRITAEWVYDEENIGEGGAEDPDWIGIGFITTDFGVLLLIAALVVAGLASRRAKRAAATEVGAGGEVAGSRVAPVLTLILLVMYVVAMWAMTAKPG
jgi:hypothetical protein